MRQEKLFDFSHQGYLDAARFYMDLPFMGMEHIDVDLARRAYVVSWWEEEKVEWNV